MEKKIGKIGTVLSLFLITPPFVKGETPLDLKVIEHCKALIERQVNPVGVERILWVISSKNYEHADLTECVREKTIRESYTASDAQYFATAGSDSAYRVESSIVQVSEGQIEKRTVITEYNQLSVPKKESRTTMKILETPPGFTTKHGGTN